MATLSRNLRLTLDAPKPSFVKTKIVATIGPKTMSVEMLTNLINAGMNVCRLNFSHGSHEYHGQVIRNLREAIAKTGKICGIMLDTKGPEIRTGKLQDKKDIDLVAGQTIKVSSDPELIGNKDIISLDYVRFLDRVKIGGKILIADGLIALTILEIHKEQRYCVCRVNNTALLGETKNVHLPGAIVDLPAVAEKDIADIQFGVEQEVDFIAASFIRKADDVFEIRKLLGDKAPKIHIISKIESQEGLDNFDAILAASDGIMVARGDLGVEVDQEKIFLAQKMMISKSNAANKPVITATQMLESMIKNPRPTRAELTDVANAVLDGTDCVMLSGETASGDYPIEAVQIMHKICAEAEIVEAQTDFHSLFAGLKLGSPNAITIAETVASYAVATAIDLNASLIVTVTETGLTTRLVCKYRPPIPVIAITNWKHTVQHLTVTRATIPMFVETLKGTEEGKPIEFLSHMEGQALELAWNQKLIQQGSRVVLVSGIMEGVSGKTNSMRVLTIGETYKTIKV